jgi:hypothetical protein
MFEIHMKHGYWSEAKQYNHSPLIDINWFQEMSSVRESLVNEPHFNVLLCFSL